MVRELSAQVARSPFGQVAVWPVVETVQRDGVCAEVLAPAPGLVRRAGRPRPRSSPSGSPTGSGVVGMLAVELFETADGVLVNELAMRPHNSGHWTIEGARTSQFEQHLRAVLDYPLGLHRDDRAGRRDGQRARRRGRRRRTGPARASTSGSTTSWRTGPT